MMPLWGARDSMMRSMRETHARMVEGEVFLSMELVRGEDLASLLRRVGRLPSEKVLDIARQLCKLGNRTPHRR